MRNTSWNHSAVGVRPRWNLAGLLLAGAFATAALPVHANLITNGSFESPAGAASPGISLGYPTGWSGFGTMRVIRGEPTPSYPAAHDGNQYVAIDNGSLAQAFVVTDAGDYDLRWFENSLTTGWNGSYAVRVLDAASATVDFQAFGYSYSGPSPWKERGLDLTLAAGAYTLLFEPGTTFTFIDQVSLTGESIPSVPDSASPVAMLGVALGCLGFVRRIGRGGAVVC